MQPSRLHSSDTAAALRSIWVFIAADHSKQALFLAADIKRVYGRTA
jgi:hypothetical protein